MSLYRKKRKISQNILYVKSYENSQENTHLEEIVKEAKLMESKWFTVTQEDNFYEDMTGKLVSETDSTYILEFKMGEKLGGLQKAQFWKAHCRFDGEY